MMKKTNFSLLFLVLFFSTDVNLLTAQGVFRASKGELFKKVSVETINDLEHATDTASVIYCIDKSRGGLFTYSSDTTFDFGISFPAKAVEGGGSWKRLVESFVDVSWYGAVGDGKVNDANALQQAIYAGVALKKQVIFPAGNFYIPNDFCLLVPGGAILQGINSESSIITTDSLLDDRFPSLVKITGNNVTLRNLGFNGGREFDSTHISDQTNGRHNIVNASYDSAVLKNITIENCVFSDAYGKGIAYKAENLWIKNCRFSRIGRYDIQFGTVDGAISNYSRPGCKNITIENNVFFNIGTHAISSYQVTGLTIRDNKLENISGIGIGNQECVDILATGNSLSFTGDNGMDFQRCENVNVSNNFFFCSGDKHAGDAGSAAAIFIGDDYGTGKSNKAIVHNNLIKGNFTFRNEKPATFQNCGIYLIDANYVKVTNNTITKIGNTTAYGVQSAKEDGNGIMLTTTQKGQSVDVQISGNSFSQIKSNAIFVSGQAREIKISDNIIERFGEDGILLRSIGTNLFSTIENNTITDGMNYYKKAVSADIFVEVQNGWITHLRISGNQLRNNNRLNFQSVNNKVQTTHGIYFNAVGFGKFNNLIVDNNQIQGHTADEIGFSTHLSEYRINKDVSFPSTGFLNNYSGSTDDSQPYIIIPGFNQAVKPEIVTESFGNKMPVYGNYSSGSIIKNINPQNGIYAWVVIRSGFAAEANWKSNKRFTAQEVVHVKDRVLRCKKEGVSGNAEPVIKIGVIKDGTVEWEDMGQRAIFKALSLQ